MTGTISMCWALVRASVRGQMQYRASFLLDILSGAFFQGLGIVFVWALLSQFQAIGGWTLNEVAMLYGFRLTAHGLYLVWFSQIFSIDQQVIDGTWDRFLVRPIHPFFQLMFSNMRITVLGDLISGVAILVAAISRLSIDWSPQHMALLVCGLIGGAMIDGAFQIGPASLTFRFLDTMPLRIIFDDTFSRFGNYPLSMMNRAAQMVLTWIVPMAFIAYLPVASLLGKQTVFPKWLGWIALPMGALFFIGSIMLFVRASRHYQSSGT